MIADMQAVAQRYMQLLGEYEDARGAWADLPFDAPAAVIREAEGEVNQLRAQVMSAGERLAEMVLNNGD